MSSIPKIGFKFDTLNEMVEEVFAYIVPDFEYLEMHHSLTGNADLKAIEDIVKKEVRRINQELLSYKRIKDFKVRLEEFSKTSTKKIKRFLFQAENIVP